MNAKLLASSSSSSSSSQSIRTWLPLLHCCVIALFLRVYVSNMRACTMGLSLSASQGNLFDKPTTATKKARWGLSQLEKSYLALIAGSS